MEDATAVGPAQIDELFVLFRVGDAVFGLPAADVVQMESFSGATAVPGTPSFVAGIMPLRGRVVPVVDLRVRFGLSPIVPNLDTRVVVTEVRGRAIALAVESAREVARLRGEDVKPPPHLLEEVGSGFVSSVAHAGDRIILVVDLEKVLGEESIHVG